MGRVILSPFLTGNCSVFVCEEGINFPSVHLISFQIVLSVSGSSLNNDYSILKQLFNCEESLNWFEDLLGGFPVHELF